MHIIVTGGFGFIGSHLVKHYLNNDARVRKVTSIDNLTTNCVKNLDHPKHELLRMNLAAPDANELHDLDQAIRECDIIYHCAGSVGVKHYDANPHLFLRNHNSIGNNLFPLVERHKKKLVYTSTSEVYGETLEARETDMLKIGSPDTLRWGYACSKLMNEFLIKSYNFPHVIARLFNVTGAGQLSTHGMVMPTFVQKAMAQEEITIYGDGKQIRSFCDIRDAVEMLVMLGEDEKYNGDIFNVGNPKNTITILELAKKVTAITKSSSKISFKPFSSSFSSHTKDIIQRKVNTDKINRYYQAKYSIEDIITSITGEHE